MSQGDKAWYYNRLKDAGVEFSKHYRDYKTDELAEAFERMGLGGTPEKTEEAEPERHEPPDLPDFEDLAAPEPEPEPVPRYQPGTGSQTATMPTPQRAEAKADEMPGERLNTKTHDEPIRTDEQGRIWYQEEVRKPAAPKPRGRRVLQYMESGTEERTVRNGDYVETFEVAGKRNPRSAQVKITLPSYQVGIYRDRRFPFKIHVYNDVQGFDFFEVCDFYGGSELVPPQIKRMYVSNVLCFDIRTTVRAIQDEYRRLQLMGKA